MSPVVNKIPQAAPNLTNPGSSGAGPAQKNAEAAKHLEARQAIQQLLAGGKTKQIVIQDPKTGQQHVMHTVQGPDGRNFMLQKAVQGHQGQQLMLHTTKDGQRLVQVPAQPGGQQSRQVIIQTSSGPQQVTLQGAAPSQLTLQTGQVPQTVTLNNSAGQQQVLVHTGPQPRLQAGTKLVQVEEPGARAQPSPSPQPGPSSGPQVQQPGIPNQAVGGQAGAGQQIIQSKIVQHNGRTYLVQVRAQKPIKQGEQIVVKTNQPVIGGGPALVQEVMDEVLRQEMHKQQEQQKISELAMQLQQQSQEHMEMVQQSPKKNLPPKPPTKLTVAQQQLLLPTEPHPLIAAQHQAKQQQLQRQQALNSNRPTTSILQQQLELPVNSGPVKPSPPKIARPANSPVQCFLCQDAPWYPTQEHLDNHYSTAHGIMKPAETDPDMDIPAFTNADLEASLSSMTDLKDDPGDFDSLLDALPPSPEPEEQLDTSASTSSASVARRKSTVITGQGTSTTRMCEICGFEPKTKNKSRERMDHLAMKHFRDQMISELRKDKPMKCPRCDVFESKDRQQLFRHMISKHKVLDGYLTEAVEKMKAEGKTPFTSSSSSSSESADNVPTIHVPEEAAPAALESQETTDAETDKKEKITQVDGADSVTEEDVDMEQLDGAVEGSDSESGAGIDAESEFSMEDHITQEGVGRKGLKLPCPICKEDMKFSRTYHFATSHFRPRLAAILPPAKPFICPDCGEEQMHKMNLWSHYIGRAHKHLDSWLNEYLQAEVKPDWCDPRPPSSRKARKNSTLLLSSNSGPSSPMVTPKKLPFSGPSTPERSSPAGKEWFCDLCHGIVPQRRETHYASLHFKEKLKTILPVSMPFICPDCNAEHKHFLNLSTHYLTQHGYLKVWLEEKGIQYEPNRKVRSMVSRVNPILEPKPEIEDLDMVLPRHQERLSVKHALSSSESEDAGDEEEETREYLVTKPSARTSLQNALSFLGKTQTKEVKEEVQVKTEPVEADNSIDTPAPVKIEKESADTSDVEATPATNHVSKRKRSKKTAEYDLKETLESLTGRPASGDPEPWAAEPPPSRVMTSAVLDDPPPHLWLCDGRLLVLEENQHKNNMKLFQEQWRRGQPVVVANVSNNLDISLWSPKAFNEQFGMLKHNIVNCKTHKMIPQVDIHNEIIGYILRVILILRFP